jgi:hypothetical protein
MKRIHIYANDISLRVLIILTVVAVASTMFSAQYNPDGSDNAWWSGWLQNFSTEMMGAIVTFGLFELLIGTSIEQKNIEQRLLLEAGSKDNAVASKAIHEIRRRGLLTGENGILQQQVFPYANWKEANLYNAHLKNTALLFANLESAFLADANLEGANLYLAYLKGAIVHFGEPDEMFRTVLMLTIMNAETTLPDGKEYDPDKGLEQLDKFVDGSWYEENDGWWTKKDE